jgi:Flp pilus assembly protein protease CpaA
VLPVILPLLVWLSYRDVKSHRIPNYGLVLLFAVSFAFSLVNDHPWLEHLIATGIVFLTAVIAYIFLGLGMGDVKLLLILILLVIPTESRSLHCFLSIFTAVCLFHVILVTRCSFRTDIAIPLAPSLSIATVAVLFL